MDPQSSESGLALIAVLVRGAHSGEAGPILDKLLAQDPTDKRAHLAKGIVEYNLGNMASASEHLQASLGQGAADAEGHYMLGMVAKQAGDIPKATEEMEASLAGNPNKMEALSSLGQFYLQLGDAEKAKTVLERAIQKGSLDSQNHYQLAQAYRKLGMNNEAREQMRYFASSVLAPFLSPVGKLRYRQSEKCQARDLLKSQEQGMDGKVVVGVDIGGTKVSCQVWLHRMVRLSGRRALLCRVEEMLQRGSRLWRWQFEH